MFRAITAKPDETSRNKGTNSPYAGHLLEFATAGERSYFDLNHARENAETPERILIHGHPMFSGDLKKYVDE